MSATACWQDEAVELLLKWGADPDLKDNDGVTAKQLARFHPHMLAGMHQQQVQVNLRQQAVSQRVQGVSWNTATLSALHVQAVSSHTVDVCSLICAAINATTAAVSVTAPCS